MFRCRFPTVVARARSSFVGVLVTVLLARAQTGAAGPPECPPGPLVIYVSADAAGGNDGTSWPNAYMHLQDALQFAQVTPCRPLEIWVAEGTYMPDGGRMPPGGPFTAGTGDRTASFHLVNGVALYGGFQGGETDRGQRNVNTHDTILSGDLANDDPVSIDNAVHVVSSGPTIEDDAALDGFRIERGFANLSGANNSNGAGMLVDGKPRLANCEFQGNIADGHGAGVAVLGNADFVNCTFAGNVASFGGGALTAGSSSFHRCTFLDNEGVGFGGAWIDGDSADFTDCLFDGNRSVDCIGCGGATGGFVGSASFHRCTFIDNENWYGGAGAIKLYGPASALISDCSFLGNRTNVFHQSGGSGAISIDSDAAADVVNCEFSANSIDFAFQVLPGGGGAIQVNGGSAIVSDSTFFGNAAPEDGMAIAAYGSSLATIANGIVWGAAGDAAPQISGMPGVSFSDVQGGHSGAGNLNADPLFVDADGPDDVVGTMDDDLRLAPGSPCIDAGSNGAVPPDELDLEGDGDFTERWPHDLAANRRFIDHPQTADTGVPAPGYPEIVDMGAHERFPDCNTNDVDDFMDIARGTSLDCNGSGTPDECAAEYPAAILIAARSNKTCELPVDVNAEDELITSESRQGGVTELRLMFHEAPGPPCPTPASIEEKRCPTPGTYEPYAGSASVAGTVLGNALVLNFAPGLEHGRTYRITIGPGTTSLAGQFVEVRALLGDVNSDGRVDGTDRSVVVSVWTLSAYSCVTDLNGDGQTNATDRSLVVSAWTSAENCAP